MANRSPYEPFRDLSSPNRNICPVTTELDGSGRLMVGGCLLSQLAERYDTPLYVLDRQTLRSSCVAYREALKKYYPGESLPLYASKANSSLILSNLVAAEGFGLDAVSEGELLTALRGGVPGERIVLHGNNKSDRELYLAYKNGVTIVIDNLHDIERLANLVPKEGNPAQLMLRFTPGIECHTHEYIRTGHLDSKFGFDLDDLEEVLLELKKSNWSVLNGLHAHIGSQIFELDPHRDLAKVMAEALQMARKIGHPIKDLNVGGGLGIKYIESDDPPSIQNWVEVVAKAVFEECLSRDLALPRLMCEPGRSLVANAGLTLYQVGSQKDIPGLKKYISVDGGMSDNPRPITYQSFYSACLADRPLDPTEETVTIAGKHCESGDVLLKEIALPSCKSGEILAVFGTGAYNSSMSSNYNRIPKPAAVMVDKGHSALVQRREGPEDLLRYDIFPEAFLELM